jgi:hypothetical protein
VCDRQQVPFSACFLYSVTVRMTTATSH